MRSKWRVLDRKLRSLSILGALGGLLATIGVFGFLGVLGGGIRPWWYAGAFVVCAIAGIALA